MSNLVIPYNQWIVLCVYADWYVLAKITDIDIDNMLIGEFYWNSLNPSLRKYCIDKPIYHNPGSQIIEYKNVNTYYEISAAEKEFLISEGKLSNQSSLNSNLCNCSRNQLLYGGCICGGI